MFRIETLFERNSQKINLMFLIRTDLNTDSIVADPRKQYTCN